MLQRIAEGKISRLVKKWQLTRRLYKQFNDAIVNFDPARSKRGESENRNAGPLWRART